MVKTAGIAVVGAGIAGLTAAQRLAIGNREVVVFDKARGVGGRTSTRRRHAAAFDHGAQYFTCRTDSFQSQVDDWCARGVAAPWVATVASIRGGAITSADARRTRYVGVPSMSSLARDLSAGLRVECGQRIDGIAKSGSSWCLVTEAGSTIGGSEAVVAATPAPQTVPLLASVPRFAELAASADMQPCHAVMLRFDEPLGVDFGGAFVSDSPLAWIARNSSKTDRPGRECWVLHTTPEWSVRLLDHPSGMVA